MRKTFKRSAKTCALVMIALCQQVNIAQTYDLLLQKATVIDGTGQAPYVAVVLVMVL